MNPYVIDKQKQVTIYILFGLGIVFSFVTGFIFGYQLASSGSITASILQSAPAIEQSGDNSGEESATTSEDGTVDGNAATETSKPADNANETAKAAGKSLADKKTVTTKTTAEKISKPVVSLPQKPAPVKPPVTSSGISPPVPKSAIKSPEPRPVVTKPVVTKPVVTRPVEKPQEDKAPVATEDPNEIPAATNANDLSDTGTPDANKKAVYTVQAGLFASRDNAVKFLDELLGNGFDAYLQDFISTSGAVKYNVRFGRSEDKQTTKQRLDEFRQAFSSPAYIVLDN